MKNDDRLPEPMRGRHQPERDVVAGNARLTIVQNALAAALLSDVRDARTGTVAFERLMVELASLVLWEACRDLPLRDRTAPNFAGVHVPAHGLAERIAGVVILRAGLVFAGPFRRLLGEAPLYQIGLRRDESTLAAGAYTDNLPGSGSADRVLILDPMLATGGSAVAALRRVRMVHRGPVDVVALIAAPLGVETVLAEDSGCRAFTIALDESLDARGFIEPGLGDAGDRLFGTKPE